jgi:MFS family permease
VRIDVEARSEAEPRTVESRERRGGPPGRPDQDAAKPPPLRRSTDYLGLWTGDAVSSFGTSMSAIAYPLLVLYATGSVARAGLITAANMVGALVTTLGGGALADRVSRKALLVISPLIQAAAAGAVTVMAAYGRVGVGWLAVAAAASGLAGGVRTAARTPAIRRIVPKEQTAVASSQIQGRDMAAQLFGSPVGGLLFSAARWVPFGADAVSYLFSALGAALIRRPLGPDRTEDGSGDGAGDNTGPGTARRSLATDVREGLRYVRTVPFLRFVATWTPAVNVVASAYFLLLIAVLRYRGAAPVTIGLVESIALVGGIAGAVAGPLILRRVRIRPLVPVGVWIFTATGVLTAVLRAPWQIGCAVFLVMFAVVPINAVLEAYQVRLVPDRLSGRVGAAVSFGSQSLQWLGPPVAGVLADLVGPPVATLIVAACLVPIALAAHLAKSLALLDTRVENVREADPPT